MIPPSSRLSSLLASRICHDLINPIGAIGNGLELLVMSGTAGGGREAPFDIAHDASRPFIAHAGRAEAQVLGRCSTLT